MARSLGKLFASKTRTAFAMSPSGTSPHPTKLPGAGVSEAMAIVTCLRDVSGGPKCRIRELSARRRRACTRRASETEVVCLSWLADGLRPGREVMCCRTKDTYDTPEESQIILAERE